MKEYIPSTPVVFGIIASIMGALTAEPVHFFVAAFFFLIHEIRFTQEKLLKAIEKRQYLQIESPPKEWDGKIGFGP